MTPANDVAAEGLGFNPFVPEDAAEPFESLQRLRQSCPVAHVESNGLPPFKLITRYADIAEIYRDWNTFSNRLGISIHVDTHVAVPFEDRSLVELDAPEHNPIRRIMLSAVSPAAVAQAVPYIEALCARTVDAFAARGTAELVSEWAAIIPSTSITHMVGVPEEDRASFRQWTVDSVAELARTHGEHPSGTARARFQEYIQGQIDIRRASSEPSDDIITRLMQLRGDGGEALTDRQIWAQLRLLISAGNDTTTNLMGSAMFHALSHPGLYERLRAEPTFAAKLIEETLRFDPPVQLFPRLCQRETEVGGALIEENEAVVLSIASGNRDEEVWGPTADEFDPDRDPGSARHFGFGLGMHFCLGAHLAREQARIGIQALVERIPTMALEEGFRYEKVDYHQFRGPKCLPVTFPSS